MLASVSGPDEAEIALLGGADVIDLKDPRQGALGAVSPDILAATIARVAGRRPVSAVAGDLPMEPEIVADAVSARAAADFVKIGLFPASAEAQRAVIAGLADLAHATPLVAVFFADAKPDFSRLDDLKAAGFAGAMIDTMDKAGGGLLRHMTTAELGRFTESCRRLGLMSGLAGSLEPPDVPRLVVLRPDYLGFRGSLTTGARGDEIDPGRVRAMRALIAREDERSASEPSGGTVATDRIFVRGMEMAMEIGAYGFERGRSQRVRFSVDADIVRVDPAGGIPQGMSDIYSYDIIMDAVRSLVARGHTDLVETLAEELAATLLSDHRVDCVGVTVEKLELGPAAVGVEIRRRRSV